jgi:hypothetical protein
MAGAPSFLIAREKSVVVRKESGAGFSIRERCKHDNIVTIAGKALAHSSYCAPTNLLTRANGDGSGHLPFAVAFGSWLNEGCKRECTSVVQQSR